MNHYTIPADLTAENSIVRDRFTHQGRVYYDVCQVHPQDEALAREILAGTENGLVTDARLSRSVMVDDLVTLKVNMHINRGVLLFRGQDGRMMCTAKIIKE